MNSKVVSLEELSSIAESLRAEGKQIVLCHGVFDLLHIGHMRHLAEAKASGDVLVVSTTADSFVKRGPGRPVFNQNYRAEALANLVMTDFVTIIDGSTAMDAIEKIRPHVYVKGPDYKNRKPDVSSRLKDEVTLVEKFGGRVKYTDDETFSSSQLINNYFNSLPEATTQYLKTLAQHHSVESIRDFLDRTRSMRVLVIGDTIIDQYSYCSPLGKSAKENLVANRFLYEESYAGGVLATANHLAEVVDHVDLVTVVGESDGLLPFIKESLNQKVTPTLLQRRGCTTTIKKRYVTISDNRKVFEVCHIDDNPLSEEEETLLSSALKDSLQSYDLVVVNDFGHGMLTRAIRSLICDSEVPMALNVQTNSANLGFNPVTNYSRAEYICIDEVEIRLATRDKFAELPELIQRLYRAMNTSQIMVTRGASGAIAYNPDQSFAEVPALTSLGVDKLGAGDAFFAYTAPCFQAGMPQELLAFLGNVVGALKLQIIGNKQSVKRADVLKYATRLLKY